MKKRIMSLFMSVLTLMFSFVPVFETYAKEQLVPLQDYQYINEYDMFCEMKEKSSSELLAEGYSADDVAEIKNFDYEAAVKERASLPVDILEKYGYTKDEIAELKELEKLDEIPAATLKAISRDTLGSSIRVSKKGTLKENGKTVNYVDLKYAFKWKRVPFFIGSDLVVIAFNSSNSSQFIYKKVSSNTHKLTADLTELATGKKRSQIVSWAFDTNSAKAVSAKFAVGMRDGNRKVTHMCWDGSGMIRLTNSSSSSRLYIDACYGHSIITLAPSFSVSISGVSVGVSFKKGMDTRHDTGFYYSNFTIDDSYVYSGVVLGL